MKGTVSPTSLRTGHAQAELMHDSQLGRHNRVVNVEQQSERTEALEPRRMHLN